MFKKMSLRQSTLSVTHAPKSPYTTKKSNSIFQPLYYAIPPKTSENQRFVYVLGDIEREQVTCICSHVFEVLQYKARKKIGLSFSYSVNTTWGE